MVSKIWGNSRFNAVRYLGGAIARQEKFLKPFEVGNVKTDFTFRAVGTPRRSI